MINTVRCPNGHFYDTSKHQVCPYCGAGEGAAASQPQPQMYPPMQPSQPPQPVNHMPQNPVNMPGMNGFGAAQPNFGQFTQGITGNSADTNKQPTVGWLVCIGGASKGKSYAIRENRNFFGRAATMDIVIEGDNSVSREKHGIITYVPKQRFFIAQPGESRELFYVNDNVVLDNVELKAYDKLEIGRSKFIFVPLCGADFSWDDYSREG